MSQEQNQITNLVRASDQDGEGRSSISKSRMFCAAAAVALAASPVSAAELVYGNWTPAQEYQNQIVMPELFRGIDKDTNGAIKWKLIAGGQIADGKTTFTAVKDGLMQAASASSPTCRTRSPSVNAIYSHDRLRRRRSVAATGAAIETMTSIARPASRRSRRFNSVLLAGWTSSAYMLACREPVRTMADLKGKRVRATGGNAEMSRWPAWCRSARRCPRRWPACSAADSTASSASTSWLKTFGYGDFAKYVTDTPLGLTGPAIGFLMNRDTWNGFTPEQKKIHLKYAAQISANQAIGKFIVENEQILETLMKNKGLQMVKVSGQANSMPIADNYEKAQRDAEHRRPPRSSASPIPARSSTAMRRRREVAAGVEPGSDATSTSSPTRLNNEIYSKVDPATSCRLRAPWRVDRLLDWLEMPIDGCCGSASLAGFLMMAAHQPRRARASRVQPSDRRHDRDRLRLLHGGVAYLPWAWIARSDGHIGRWLFARLVPRRFDALARDRRQDR